MNRKASRAIPAVALVVASFSLQAQIELKSGTVALTPATTNEFFSALEATPDGVLHGLAGFSRHPSRADRKFLEAFGVTVLDPLHRTVYRVRVRRPADAGALTIGPLKAVFARLRPEDRLEPKLKLVPDEWIELTVRIHRGVTEAEARTLLGKYQKPLETLQKQSDETWLVLVNSLSLPALGGEDRVLWINATPSFFEESDKTRAAIGANAVQNLDPKTGRIRGRGGRGVQVGVFDFGIDETHGDFSPRRVVRNDAAMNRHATHVAGIIGGNGAMSTRVDSCGIDNRDMARSDRSAYQWRGIAPLAELIDIPQMPPRGRNGANAATHRHYIEKHGMDVSNHSYIFNENGTYDNGNLTRDQIIRGDATADGIPVRARLQVTSAGNKGWFFSLSKQLKNALVVGNWDLERNRIAGSSSLGPASDGRIKPDVVAPGTSVIASGFCSDTALRCRDPGPLCSSAPGLIQRQNHYRSATGSSVSAAVTTGAIALLLEQYAITYKVDLDHRPPLPASVRGVMIHTARDSSAASGGPQPAVGPDFVTGWGLIDADAAVKIVKEKRIEEGGAVTGTCEKLQYYFDVKPGAKGPIRVTLAWDDVAADPALPDSAPKLVNDLDLVVIDPQGTSHLPWQLDQRIAYASGSYQCGSAISVGRQLTAPPANDGTAVFGPAAAPGRDHLNNVEVVDISGTPTVGTWKVVVTGFNIPQGPQRFSLIGHQFREYQHARASK